MTFLSALILGLLASAHCAGMCGGLQMALQQPSVIRSVKDNYRHLVLLNLGRLSTYTVAGILFSTFGSAILTIIDIPQATQFARNFTAFILLMIGIQLLLSKQKPFIFIERFGATLWRKISKGLSKSTSNKLSNSYYRGLIWGFLPCGLIYGVLVTTIFSPSIGQAAAVMIGFGLGTLPAMILTGGLYQHLRRLVSNRSVQIVGGLVFIQGGVLMLIAPKLINKDFMNAYPQIMSTMFCFT